MSLWLPTLLVIVLTALALTAAGSTTAASATGRRLWMAGLFVFGCLAIGSTIWLALRESEEIFPQAGTSAAPPSQPAAVDGSSASRLTFRLRVLEDRVKELEAGREARSIPQKAADDLGLYLKQVGSRRVIVSCTPNDLEAYYYANQLVNIFKAADWEAQGPQMTKIFGDLRSPAINVYIQGDSSADTAKILLAGFAKFNIPYQSRVTPSGATPDTESLELFIGTK